MVEQAGDGWHGIVVEVATVMANVMRLGGRDAQQNMVSSPLARAALARAASPQFSFSSAAAPRLARADAQLLLADSAALD